MKNITTELKTWLQTKGVQVDLDSAILTHDESAQLYGLLTTLHGVAPEQVVNVPFFPEILPSALLDEIMGLEPAVIPPTAPVAPVPPGSTNTGNEPDDGAGAGTDTGTGVGDSTPMPPDATEAPAPEATNPEPAAPAETAPEAPVVEEKAPEEAAVEEAPKAPDAEETAPEAEEPAANIKAA